MKEMGYLSPRTKMVKVNLNDKTYEMIFQEKAVKEMVNQDDHGEKINQDKKDAAMKKTDAKKTFKELRQVKLGDKGKTATGKDAGVIELEPQARPI